ncbi:MAG TPA: type II toxin-antitoxin system HicA family toxin [Blastocatellia bacterium]|nr:type II toxin-antitoxin system HicA family toxin [Blastocatellia bacterium]
MQLNPLPYREIKRRLEAAGFVEVSQEGSHVKFRKVTNLGTYTAIVPKKNKNAPVGTIRSILRQAEITPEEWNNL